MRLKTVAALLTVLVMGLVGPLAGAQGAVAERARQAKGPPSWAPANAATIHPGVQTVTEGAQCTANFVFYDRSGNVYLGQSAHCSGKGAADDTNGCEVDSLPLGTRVKIDGATAPGTLVYSSWIAMQQRRESDADSCSYNDFALVKAHRGDVARVNPSIPFYGGPRRGRAQNGPGDKVYSYGNSGLRLGLSALSPKEGYSVRSTGNGWNHLVYTVTPGVPGDSGSAFLSADGKALGTLSTLSIAPDPAANGVSDLRLQLRYARRFGGFAGLRLAFGTEEFRRGLLP